LYQSYIYELRKARDSSNRNVFPIGIRDMDCSRYGVVALFDTKVKFLICKREVWMES